MIKVKMVDRGSKDENSMPLLRKQFPGEDLVWGNCLFSFDPFDSDYDWFVVRDDVPRVLPYKAEELKCSKKNTILITSEPSSITFYGKAFAEQFEYLITNQREEELPHHNAQRSQVGSMWFYGRTYDEIKKQNPPEKSKQISIIASNKQEKHTAHKTRFDFTNELIKKVPEVDVLFSYKHLVKEFYEIFGDRAKLVNNKIEMLDDYKYHLSIGNQVGPHILTERVTDALLAYTVPISFGCTNLVDYFPKNSFIDIDITSPDVAIEKIKDVISSENDYENRLSSVVEARRRVLDEYNIIAMIASIVDRKEPEKKKHNNGKIYSRKIKRLVHPPDLKKHVFLKIKNFIAGLS